MFIKKLKQEKYNKGVILNQPIETEENDWIGILTYVDKLNAAIESGATMIGITSDFGAGKSSIISLFKRKYGQRWFLPYFRPKYVHTINMWDTVYGDDECEKISVTDLHKTFLFHVINQISVTKGSYISKRLSKNYGLFSVQSSSFLKNVLLTIMIISFMLGKIMGQYGTVILEWMNLDQENPNAIMLIAYGLALFCAVMVLFKSDFIFSSSKSEGNREIDENVLIDYYNHEILYRKFFRHYIFVIEDLDRIDDYNLIKGFLKEIRKYYLTDKNLRSKIHNNKVTFVINIKPETSLISINETYKNAKNYTKEKLYPKFFDYILNLRKINIDNYDTILNGYLKELRTELVRLKLINEGQNITSYDVMGMQWLIRGENIGIREIKNRLNMSLALYENLVNKFGDDITFERCAIAIYLINQYESDFTIIKDRDFEHIVEQYLLKNIVDGTESWGDDWDHLSSEFKTELFNLVDNKIIDNNYRIYFYNIPKNSKLYNLSETLVFNSIVYKEKPKKEDEYNIHLKNVSNSVIIDAYKKLDQLNLNFPRFILEYEDLFIVAANNFQKNMLGILSSLSYDSANMNSVICSYVKI